MSLAVKGGPRYGIDFRGGALITVSFASARPSIKFAPRYPASSPWKCRKYPARTEDIIGIDVARGCRTAEPRARPSSTALTATFGQPANGKYNINSGGAAALADRLRDPLQTACVPACRTSN